MFSIVLFLRKGEDPSGTGLGDSGKGGRECGEERRHQCHRYKKNVYINGFTYFD